MKRKVVTMMMGAALIWLMGCGSAEESGTALQTETEATQEIEETEGAEETKQEETDIVQEGDAEVEMSMSEMPEGELDLDGWVDSLGKTEVQHCIWCIWNEGKKAGYVLENYHTYQLEAGDIVVLIKSEPLDGFTMGGAEMSNFKNHGDYNSMEISFSGEGILFNPVVKTELGEEYHYICTLLAAVEEEETIEKRVNINDCSTMPIEKNSPDIEEWLTSLNTTEIQYCIWNEAKSEGYVLENYGTYQLEEEDLLLISNSEEIATYETPWEVETWLEDFCFMERHDTYISQNVIAKEDGALFCVDVTTTSGEKYHYIFTLIMPWWKE